MEGYVGLTGFVVLASALMFGAKRHGASAKLVLTVFAAIGILTFFISQIQTLNHLMGAVGVVFFIAVAYLFSTAREHIKWRPVFWGLALQLIFALIILKTQLGRTIFSWFNDMVIGLLSCAQAGANFVFGNLASGELGVVQTGGSTEALEGASFVANTGFVFAFSVLPTIIFFASFMAVMYHLGVMEKIIRALGKLMEKTLKTSGAESMSAASNIFVGQTEAPLVVKPFIAKMTESEIMAIMTAGFATVAGSVMAAFVGFLVTGIPEIAGHLMAASIMSAPAALVIAKIFVPETAVAETAGGVNFTIEKPDKNVIDAAARGASDGLKLAFNVAAMVVAFLGLIALANAVLGWVGGQIGMSELNLAYVFGKIFAPIAYLIGVDWADTAQMGNLIGTKLMANEFVAYLNLQTLVANQEITERTMIIASYALCGFANLGSIGIQIGGLSALAPSKRTILAKYGLRAMFAGAFASLTTACIAGILIA